MLMYLQPELVFGYALIICHQTRLLLQRPTDVFRTQTTFALKHIGRELPIQALAALGFSDDFL